MLVFIDETGDPGLKTDKGSSRYLVIALVIFDDHSEANACDNRIGLLGKQLGYPEGFTFHFSSNSHRVRLRFLQAVASFKFCYYGIVLNKDLNKLYGKGFKYKDSLYKFACKLVFENCKSRLKDAIIVIDKRGKKVFRSQLARYLKAHINTKDQAIKEVKMQPDRGNHLIQLADYVASVINRCEQKKKNAQLYKTFIAEREVHVQRWPK